MAALWVVLSIFSDKQVFDTRQRVQAAAQHPDISLPASTRVSTAIEPQQFEQQYHRALLRKLLHAHAYLAAAGPPYNPGFQTVNFAGNPVK